MKITNDSKYVFKSKNDGLFWPGEKDIEKSPSFSGSDVKQIYREDKAMKTEFELILIS